MYFSEEDYMNETVPEKMSHPCYELNPRPILKSTND